MGILASAFVLAVIVSVLVVILAGWAVIQRQEALNAKAELDRNISIGLAYAAEEALARDLDLGVLLAYEAVRLYIDNKEAVKDAQDAQEALIQAIQQSPPHYTLAGPKTGVASLAFRSDGRLVIAAQDGLVTIWDLLSKEKLQLHDWSGQEMDETEIVSVVLSPNGQQLATVDLDGTVKLWDVTLGQELSSLPDLEGEATSLTFNPDGKLLATANWDGTVKIWDVTSGKEWKPLSGLEGGATNLTFSSDGQWLAALNGWEGTVKIWDVRSRKEEVLNTLRGFEMATTNPAFSPDRTRLVTAGMDGTITVWDMTRDEAEYQILDELKGDENSTALTPEDLTTVWESACRHTSRNLTYDEWAANLGEIRNISPQTCSNRPIDLSFIVEYIRQGEKLEAMKSLIEDPATLAAITAAYPEAYIKLAGQYSEQGKYQKAANTLDQAVKQKNKPTNVELAEAYYNICVSSSYSDAEPYQPACKQAATLAPQTSDPAMNLEFCQNAVSYDLNDQAVVQAVCQQAVKLATQSADVYSLSDLCAYGPEGGLAQEEIQAVCQKAVDLATQLEDLYSLSYLCAYGPEGGPAKDIVQAACQWTLDLATQSEDLYSLSDLCTSGRDAELPEDIVGPICQRTLDLVTKLEDLDSLSYLCTFGRDAGYLDNIVEAACQRVDEIDPSS